MPKQYEDIRDSYISRGTPPKEAKRIAAKTFIKRGNIGTRTIRAKQLAADRTSGR